jgi:hypothetical protein
VSEGLIYKQIAAVMADIPSIGKDRQAGSGGFSYKFRGIDEVYNALHPLLAKHKVFPMPEVLEVEREYVTTKKDKKQLHTKVKVKYTFYAEDGSNVSCVTIGEGMDSGDKSGNKAMSGAEKYAFFQMFCIPTDEPKDSENDSPEVASVQDEFNRLMDDAKKNTAHVVNLKNWYKKHEDEINALPEKERASVKQYVATLREELEKELADKPNPDAEAIEKDAERGEGEQEPLIPDGSHPGEE